MADTFSHRSSVVASQETGERAVPGFRTQNNSRYRDLEHESTGIWSTELPGFGARKTLNYRDLEHRNPFQLLDLATIFLT